MLSLTAYIKMLFHPGAKSVETSHKETHKMREGLSQPEIDKTIEDSFPASDPPSWH